MHFSGGINRPPYFAPFAAALAEQVDVPVICVGGWRSIESMENVLNDTIIAFLSLSRPLLREPDWPNKLKNGKSAVSKCVSCNACYDAERDEYTCQAGKNFRLNSFLL